MKPNADISTISLPEPFEHFKDVNFGIVLLSVYILFDFGAFQGVYEIVNALRLPLMLSLLSLFYAIYLVAKKKVDLKSPTTRWFIIFFVYLIGYSQLSSINAVDKKSILTLFLQYLANYFIMVACVKKPSQFIFIIDVWLFAILHSNYHVFHQGGRIWDSIWLRGENNVGLIGAFAVPFAFFLFTNYKNSIKKYFYLISMITSITGVVMANSRGGFVALAVVSFFCWKFVANKIRVLLLILMAAMLVVQLAPDSFFTELKSLEQGTEEGTANERVYSWGLAVDMFVDYPVFGVGPFNYPEYFLEYDHAEESRFGINAPGYKRLKKRVAHSTQFQWLAEFGIVGVIVLLYFQISLYRNWKVIYELKIPNEMVRLRDVTLLKTLTHANLITQLGYWIGALFISIIHYPFYWLLPAFSEVWKNIYINYVNEAKEAESKLD